jgi:hypothetical protein
MKALSIRQPWAWLIVNGHKDIENRDWATNFRGRVLIHASDAEEYPDQYGGSYPARESMIGGIVGVATITGCVDRSDSKWFMGQYGFTLTDAKPLPFIACKGALGFFNVPSEVADQLRRLHSAGQLP